MQERPRRVSMNAMPVVAIHQPNFFPWLGFFDKLARCDVFIVMDEVQFPKAGAGGWTNRVPLLINGASKWVTVPVVRSHHGVRSIRETEISEDTPWRERLLEQVRHSYGKAPHYAEAMTLLTPLIEERTPFLSAYNSKAIVAIAGALGIPASRLVPMSTLPHAGSATDLLIALVKAGGGDTYLCGAGSSGYLEPEKFEAASIRLVYQNFKAVEYPQRGVQAFVPGLSIIDAFVSCGITGAAALLLGQSR